ncbi:cyclohex-1-ene-1-carboxylate:CoA ligase [Mycobacterium malmoense]|uniref:class I adenylate-forming enzyme family protein n=1 Tax=Mycobacterium malmoense TaxID=1780 RepID=UPI00080B01BC|nr:AMP-binding protein [Mycobacterium malmoense]OCB24401.1 cyclohex-1-ene-1-carboxylate:CoA ligase [Mycobacterium malmoense]
MDVDTVAGLLDERAEVAGERPLLRDAGQPGLTIGETAGLTARATRWLRSVGVRPGMTVAWQLPSHVRASLLMLALARTNVTQAPLVHIYRTREVAAAVEIAKADLTIVDESTENNCVAAVPTVVLPADFVEQLRALPEGPDEELTCSRSPTDARWIYFTSGTGGRPKGVLHSDESLFAAAGPYTDYLGLGTHPDEVAAMTFPIAHIGGMMYMLSALLGGFEVVLFSKFDAKEMPRLLADYKVTITGGSSTFYHLLLTAQLESGCSEPLVPTLRMLMGGGAACPPELHNKVQRHLGVSIMHGYGMTEAPMVCLNRPTDTSEQQRYTSGSPNIGVELRIVGGISGATPGILPHGVDGEIEIRGANLTSGYIDRSQWLAATTPDGWFRTGDRGYLRPDGHIVISGRSKDLIIRKGENIAPDEVQNELLGHPLVDDVVVLGLPDELRGELVCAVVKKSTHHADVALDELCAYLESRGLMKQKWPERLVVVDDFPLTGLGKVDKAALLREISGGVGDSR